MNTQIKWEIFDPLGRNYYWLDVLEPILLNNSPVIGSAGILAQKAMARKLAQQAFAEARRIHAGKEIQIIRVKREIRPTSKGVMRCSYLYFKIRDQNHFI